MKRFPIQRNHFIQLENDRPDIHNVVVDSAWHWHYQWQSKCKLFQVISRSRQQSNKLAVIMMQENCQHLISIYKATQAEPASEVRNYCLLEATLHFCTGYEANADHWHHDDSLLNFKFALDLIWWYIALGLGFRVNSPTQCVNVWAAVTGTVWLRLRLTWIIMMAQMIMIAN